ncbi:unnamed protein product, partial [Pylaiella littoralis]
RTKSISSRSRFVILGAATLVALSATSSRFAARVSPPDGWSWALQGCPALAVLIHYIMAHSSSYLLRATSQASDEEEEDEEVERWSHMAWNAAPYAADTHNAGISTRGAARQ